MSEEEYSQRQVWIGSLVTGAAASIVISIGFWYGETHSATGATAALLSCLVAMGMPVMVAGTMIGIIASGIPHSGDMSIMIIAATCVNFGLYTLVTYAVIRVFRAAARRLLP